MKNRSVFYTLTSMKKTKLFFFLFLIVISCNKNSDETLDSQTTSLIETLNQELYPLSAKPLNWSDNDMSFLDAIGDKPIVGLGEATHGTSEFFDAKHRIFKYLVENHNFKIFAIEADFGESLLINNAVQRGAKSEIEQLMKDKMHFWTWRTTEVKNLLEWMCDYNLNKTEEEKLQYMGVDCQLNTYHPYMLKDYLLSTEAPFLSSAEQILNEAETANQIRFESYTTETFSTYLKELDALHDSIITHSVKLINASSEKEYELHLRILEVIIQVSKVQFADLQKDLSENYRDQYMAENTIWLNEYFNGEKMVLWAHNGHISYNLFFGSGGSMGLRLASTLGKDYVKIGFLFSRGTFNARTQKEGQKVGGLLQKQLIEVNPKTNSINYVMDNSNESVFIVKLADLKKYSEWNDIFTNRSMEYFDIGAIYNNKPEDYYKWFSSNLFDYVIYFDNSTASSLISGN